MSDCQNVNVFKELFTELVLNSCHAIWCQKLLFQMVQKSKNDVYHSLGESRPHFGTLGLS